MCIIATKAAGIPMPNRERIKTMWDGNRDGAGLMYVENGQVRIEKGFMKYKDFTKVLDRLEKRLDLTATPVVMHFRITTHGGTKPENCHPFPITDNVGALKKLTITTDLGVAHNGIIPISPRKGISDTMEYIASQLAPLKKALPRFYENKHAMLLIKNAIESKMAFLTKEGKLYTIGDFVVDEGVLYSNNSYQGRISRYRDYAYGCYGLDEWETYSGYDAFGLTKIPATVKKTSAPKEGIRQLMWLDECDHIVYADGEMIDGEYGIFLIDETGTVYEYDWDADCAAPVSGARAFNAENLPLHFDEELAEDVYVVL